MSNVIPKCADCAHAQKIQLPPPNIGSQLQCYRFPPTPCLAFGQDPRTGSVQPVGGVTMHPTVKPDDWCAEFLPPEAPKLLM